MDEVTPIIPDFIRRNGIIIAIGIVGLGLVGFGLMQVLTPKDDGVVIEKAQSASSDSTAIVSPASTKKIVIDVEGAVEKPGIYTLASESREQDAITAAGGLSPKADNASIAKEMNMAAKLSDGMKLYVPFVGDTSAGSVQGSQDLMVQGAATGSISVNSANESQLDSLPGVGSVTATKIIQNRPYASLDELVSKKAVSKSTFDKIKDLISL